MAGATFKLLSRLVCSAINKVGGSYMFCITNHPETMATTEAAIEKANTLYLCFLVLLVEVIEATGEKTVGSDFNFLLTLGEIFIDSRDDCRSESPIK